MRTDIETGKVIKGGRHYSSYPSENGERFELFIPTDATVKELKKLRKFMNVLIKWRRMDNEAKRKKIQALVDLLASQNKG